MHTRHLLTALLVVAPILACAQAPLKPIADAPRPIRPASECSEVMRALAADSTSGEYRPAAIQKMSIVEYYTREWHVAHVGVRVSPAGRVDSVVIRGTEKKEFIAAIRASTKQYRYRPATVNDCAVPSWDWFQITTGAP